jgi:hypothetical protein
MAINIQTTPLIRPNGDYRPISTVNYPLYSTWNLSTTNIYDDFHYNVELNDENGLVNLFQVIAVDNDLFGNLSVNGFVDSRQQVDINSMIDEPTDTPNHLKTYQLKITPYNNNTLLSGDSSTTDTFCLMKGYRKEDLFFSHEVKMLIDHKKKKLTSDSYFTNKALFGSFNPSGSIYDIYYNNIYFVLTKANGDIYIFTIEVNNSYITLNYNTLTNADSMILELPVGPKNIMLQQRLVEKTVIGGVVSTPNTLMDIPIESGDSYTYVLREDRDLISNIYDIEIIDCDNRYKPTNLLFNTDTFSFNAFTFYDKKRRIIKNKQETYLSDNHERVGVSYIKTPADQDINIYKDDVDEIIILNSGWLSKAEVEELEELWVATKIRYQDGDELIPIYFDTIEKEVYNDKDRDLKKYTVSFIKANKKYYI